MYVFMCVCVCVCVCVCMHIKARENIILSDVYISLKRFSVFLIELFLHLVCAQTNTS